MGRRKGSKNKKVKAIKQNTAFLKEFRKSRRNVKGIGLTCQSCGTDIRINTAHPELYTDELRENYICLNCRKDI